MPTDLVLDLHLLVPEFIVLGAAMLAIVLELVLPGDERSIAVAAVSFLGLVAAFLAVVLGQPEGTALQVMAGETQVTGWVSDSFSRFCRALLTGGGALLVLMSFSWTRRLDRGHGEYFALLLFALAGVMFTSGVSDLLSMFVCLELVTIMAYILAAFRRNDPRSTEAGLKYLLVGAVSTAILLLGIAFVYGATGSLSLDVLGNILGSAEEMARVGWLLGFGLVLMVTGLLFKLGGVPFHVWIPDVYEGAPAPVTGFLSTASKAAGLILLMRLGAVALGPHLNLTEEGAGDAFLPWAGLIAVIAMVSLLFGTMAAIPQRGIKRMLAYSSIGHAGYLLMGIAAMSSASATTEARAFASQALLFYLVAYFLTNVTVFTAVSLVARSTDSSQNDAWKGLATRSPFLGLTMLLCLLSLAGVPPMSGFFGKFLVLNAAVKSDMTWLAFVGAGGVVISLYFYMLWIKDIYVSDPVPGIDKRPLEIPGAAKAVLWVGIITMIGLGVFQAPLMDAAKGAAEALVGAFHGS